MKTNKSNKKAVTILSLAMVLALPITSHADEQTPEDSNLKTPSYIDEHTDSKLKDELSDLVDQKKDEETNIEKSNKVSEEDDNVESVEEEIESNNTSEVKTDDIKDSDVDKQVEDNQIKKYEENIIEYKKEGLAEEDAKGLSSDLLNDSALNEEKDLEVSPESEKTQLKAGKGQQVNNKVHVSNINIQYKDGGSQKEEVWVTSAGHAAFTADYTVDDDVKSGDYFTVSYGDNVVPGLVNEPRTSTNLMDARGRMIAQGVYDKDSNTTTYKFTDYVDIFNNVHGSFQKSMASKRTNYRRWTKSRCSNYCSRRNKDKKYDIQVW